MKVPRYTSEQLREALRDKSGVIVAGGEKIDDSVVAGLDGVESALCFRCRL